MSYYASPAVPVVNGAQTPLAPPGLAHAAPVNQEQAAPPQYADPVVVPAHSAAARSQLNSWMAQTLQVIRTLVTQIRNDGRVSGDKISDMMDTLYESMHQNEHLHDHMVELLDMATESTGAIVHALVTQRLEIHAAIEAAARGADAAIRAADASARAADTASRAVEAATRAADASVAGQAVAAELRGRGDRVEFILGELTTAFSRNLDADLIGWKNIAEIHELVDGIKEDMLNVGGTIRNLFELWGGDVTLERWREYDAAIRPDDNGPPAPPTSTASEPSLSRSSSVGRSDDSRRPLRDSERLRKGSRRLRDKMTKVRASARLAEQKSAKELDALHAPAATGSGTGAEI